MVEGWTIGLAANAIIAIAYLAVAGLLGATAIRTNQWRSNPLGVATALLYVGCGGGHAVYALQFAEVALGSASPQADGARLLYAQAHMWAWDVITAIVGVWYWTQRRRFPTLVTGAAVFEDLRIRQKRALQINDNLVQGLARAKLSIELDRTSEGRAALAETRQAGERIIHELARLSTAKEGT